MDLAETLANFQNKKNASGIAIIGHSIILF